jgi:hypothetical protein
MTSAWGGAMAFRKTTYQQLRVEDEWRGALIDDHTLCVILRRHGIPVHFVPSCIVLSSPDYTWREFIAWGQRQFFFVRVTFLGDWLGALIGVTLFSAMLIAQSFVPNFFLALTPFLLGAAALHFCLSGGELLAHLSDHHIPTLPRRHLLLAPLLPYAVLTQIIASATSRKIWWRGIRYHALTHNTTRIIQRAEQV